MHTASTTTNSPAQSRRWALWSGRSSANWSLERRVRQLESNAGSLSDSQLQTQAIELRDRTLSNKKATPQTLAQFGGLIAESVQRTFGFRLHDVQVRAMIAGSQGAIVEMQTGEGKTVVTGAMAALRSLTTPAVHVATTNAYLAGRDLEELQPVFERLGLSSGLLPDGNDMAAAQAAYKNVVTYGPGYQFGFDYLRDQVVLRTAQQSRLGRKTLSAIRGDDIRTRLMQPAEHHAMIIDEADSVMIDEAVTPLVISGAARELEDATPFQLAKKIAGELQLDEDFTIELPDKKIQINDDASERCHEAVANNQALNLDRPWRIYLSNALRAIHVLQRDIDYVVIDGEVQIVDQNTGRIFSDRTWQDGLHQAVEAREDVEIKSAADSVARITRQRYLQMYDQLAGLTGTASAVKTEFDSVYQTKVVTIPTHLPNQRQVLPARFFRDVEAKVAAVANDVAARKATGQPVLVGTRTIAESKLVAEALTAAGIDAVLLNGVQDRDEAEIVGAAGQFGAVTIATNMAGRGTDIKLDARSLAAGGLHVLGFSPNASTRIDRQLIGRAARQGNPGSAQFFVSPEDDLIATHAPKLGQRIASRAAATGESRQSFAKELLALQQEVEGRQYQSRQAMIRQDRWMDLVRESIEN